MPSVLRRMIAIGGICAAVLGGPASDVVAQSPPERTPEVKNRGDGAPRLPARSTPADSAGSLTKSRATTPTTSIWGTVAALAVVIGGLAIAGRYLRKHGPAALRALPHEAVEPLGQRLLSRGVSVHLLRCGTRVLIVGVGPDGARTLSEITDPAEVDLLTGACRRRDSERPSFARALRRTDSASRPIEPVAPYTRPLATEVDGV
jgi:flagellar biogenesis protein FliO